VIVIDTHIWIWAAQGEDRLSTAQADALKKASEEDALVLSTISLWEVAMLIDRGRIKTKRTAHEWIHAALTIRPIRLANLTPSIACQAFDLPKGFHKDPADRIIAATALDHDVPLVTSDKQIIQHPDITTIN